jgi:hypothetical protein
MKIDEARVGRMRARSRVDSSSEAIIRREGAFRVAESVGWVATHV